MSSGYPMLDNRSIDQLKVTELKEELKKRRLSYSGLKVDLIKRLDEAIRGERENESEEEENEAKEEENQAKEDTNGFNEQQPADEEKEVDSVPADTMMVETAKEDNIEKQVDTSSVLAQPEATDDKDIDTDSLGLTKDSTTPIIVENNKAASDPVGSKEALSSNNSESLTDQADEKNMNSKPDDITPIHQKENEVPDPQLVNVGQTTEPQQEDEDVKSQLDIVDQKPQLDIIDQKPQLETEDLKPHPDSEGLKPSIEDVSDISATNNQVSEVSPNLGFQVKSDSISTDSVSINEKSELKDNIIDDNVKLDIDVVKSEMVEPSSSKIVPVSDESHPMEVEETFENKPSIEERDEENVADPDMKKKIDIPDVIYSEKLNLDRSSGEDSMEEDVPDSKQIDSKFDAGEVGNKRETNEIASVREEVASLKEESLVDVVGDGISSDRKDTSARNQGHPAALAEKRKLHDVSKDQETVASLEPSKRRKWSSEGIKVPDHKQAFNLTPRTTPKEATQPIAMKRNFARSNSMACEEESKERVVPPPQRPPTSSLRIDQFLRPFTLKAVHELLGNTGSVTSFWMDQIKTHCYVTYSSVEEANATRNAVYNLKWPAYGGRQLVAEFVDPQEVKMRLEAPPQGPTTSGATVSVAPPTEASAQPKPSPRQQASRQQLPPPSALPLPPPPPPPLSNPPPAAEHLPPPPPLEKEPPIVTLDDLFRKTKSTPRIYYLPLSEEQVAAKVAARAKNTIQ